MLLQNLQVGQELFDFLPISNHKNDSKGHCKPNKDTSISMECKKSNNMSGNINNIKTRKCPRLRSGNKKARIHFAAKQLKQQSNWSK